MNSYFRNNALQKAQFSHNNGLHRCITESENLLVIVMVNRANVEKLVKFIKDRKFHWARRNGPGAGEYNVRSLKLEAGEVTMMRMPVMAFKEAMECRYWNSDVGAYEKRLDNSMSSLRLLERWYQNPANDIYLTDNTPRVSRHLVDQEEHLVGIAFLKKVTQCMSAHETIMMFYRIVESPN